MNAQLDTPDPLSVTSLLNIVVQTAFMSLLLLGNTTYAHESGVTDTSIQIGHSSIKLVYTLPIDALDLLRKQSGLPTQKIISQGFVVKNDTRPCNINYFQQKTLNNINSAQFILLLQCDGPLQNLNLGYYLLNQEEDHQNFTRISIAGRDQNVSLSGEKNTHKIPVAYLLNLWGKKLSDDLLASASSIAEPSLKNSQNNNSSIFSALFNSISQSKHYFPIGLQHILQGYDHVLFLIGLLLLPLGFKHLLLLASAFTLAHSISLALSVLNIIRLPSALVEAAIAASIIYVTLENLWHLRPNTKIDKLVSPWKRRTIMTFMFGLIHGFGFSYLLTEIGLGDQVAGALLYFNLGVEAGQLLIIALVFPALVYVFKRQQGVIIARFGSFLIGGVGSMWLVERLSAI